MSLFFRSAYRLGFKPWDSGIPPPELVAFVEGEGRGPGKALDLGCGTGTNCIYLVQHGWDATGVDFVPRAIGMAKRKASAAGVSPHFAVGDVTRLPELGIGKDFALLFDLGCFHSIPDELRDRYVDGATRAAAPGATLLMFGLVRNGRKTRRFGPRGVERGEVERRFSGWRTVSIQEGRPMLGFGTAWHRLERALD